MADLVERAGAEPPHPPTRYSAENTRSLRAFRAPILVPDRIIAVLLALHDIGKFTRLFWGKVPELWPPVLGDYPGKLAGFQDDAGYALSPASAPTASGRSGGSAACGCASSWCASWLEPPHRTRPQPADRIRDRRPLARSGPAPPNAGYNHNLYLRLPAAGCIGCTCSESAANDSPIGCSTNPAPSRHARTPLGEPAHTRTYRPLAAYNAKTAIFGCASLRARPG
jgi:hypothetical protein